MMNNNHKKSGCGFDEELVSYIYGESDAGSKEIFEAHLAACSICADELEAFSGLHFAINDWKASEFAALETPAIELPYPQTAGEISNHKEWWLPAFVRDIFSLSPRGLSLAAASVAILAVAFGAVLFMIKSNGGKDLAGSNKTSNPAVVPTLEKSPETPNTNSNNPPPQTDQKAPSPEILRQPETKPNRAVRVVEKQRPTQKAENANAPKNNDVKRINNKNKPVQAQEIPDEDEDNTLRLAELFEEIETRD